MLEDTIIGPPGGTFYVLTQDQIDILKAEIEKEEDGNG